MNAQEYKSMMEFIRGPKVVSLSEVDPGRERTLMYGYTGVSETFHLYVKDGQFHLYIYRNHYGKSPDEVRFAVSYDELPIGFLPHGHIYPSASDAEFCKLVLQKGHTLSIAPFEERPETAFHGKLIGQES